MATRHAQHTREPGRDSLVQILERAKRSPDGSVTVLIDGRTRVFSPHSNGGGLVEQGQQVPHSVSVDEDAVVPVGTSISSSIIRVHRKGVTYHPDEFDS